MSRVIRAHALVAFGFALTFPAGGHAQINQGQIDTFETGTTLGWHIGIGFVGPSVQLGGPGGANDHFLQLISGQAGGPPRWTMFNQNQWVGNYNSPAPPGSDPVNAIEMDIINFSATFLATRVAIKVGGGQTAGWSFNGGVTPDGANDIPPDGLWHHVVFPINAATMAPVNDQFGTPPPPLATLLGAVGELRILHSANPVVNGDLFTGRAGVDNIHAIFLPVPEPTGIFAAALCASLILGPARRWWRGQ